MGMAGSILILRIGVLLLVVATSLARAT